MVKMSPEIAIVHSQSLSLHLELYSAKVKLEDSEARLCLSDDLETWNVEARAAHTHSIWTRPFLGIRLSLSRSASKDVLKQSGFNH